MTTFQNRLGVAVRAQNELKALLTDMGFTVFDTGQENWLAESVHSNLRFNHSDKMVRAIRYMPDLLAHHAKFPIAYWEVKVNTHPGTPNFTIEKACYEECKARHDKGERIIVAFKDTNQLWYANFITALTVARDMSDLRHNARGSQTPYLLIHKSSTLELSDFLAL